jgi:arginine exporter protein ArgO
VIAALVAGLLAGYGIAMPLGAVATYLMALAARAPLRTGACAALGVGTADGAYALIAVIGGSALAQPLQSIVRPLRWASALVLIALAARVGAAAIRQFRERPAGIRAADTAPLTPAGAYLALCGITMLNPLTVVYFTALVIGGQATAAPGWLARGVFTLAAFAASASWHLLLVGGGALAGRALAGRRGRLLIAMASSALITILALRQPLPAM